MKVYLNNKWEIMLRILNGVDGVSDEKRFEGQFKCSYIREVNPRSSTLGLCRPQEQKSPTVKYLTILSS
jgi:hypothetical protein